MGDGTTTNRKTPVSVSGLSSSIAGVAGGAYHSLAFTQSGSVYVWGYNAYGQLGDGTTVDHRTPELVAGVSNIIAVAAGVYSSYALAADGTLWDWGYNAHGELGLGDTTMRLTPAHLLPPAGYRFTLVDSGVGAEHV